MSFQLICMQLFNGLTLGSLYILLSLGLSVIFGMLGIINFAHGAFYMLGAYAAYTLISIAGLNFWVGLVAAPVFVALLGGVLEKSLLKKLYSLHPLYNLLLTFGLMMVLQDLVRLSYGTMGVPFQTPELLQGAVDIGFMYYPKYRLFIIFMAFLASLGVVLFLNKTRLGTIIRAGTDNELMVEAMGINISKVFTFVFAFGVLLAALAGVLASPIQNVEPDMGLAFLVDCFVVVVIGGLGSLRGTILGGIIVGETIAIGTIFWPPMAHALIFFLMIIFLLFRPRGLFGRVGFHE